MRWMLLAVSVCFVCLLPGAAHGVGDAERRHALLPPIPVNDTAPAWAPDGTRVVYMRRFSGLQSISAEGSDERSLTTNEAEHAALSPDGEWLAYVGLGRTSGLFTSPTDRWEPRTLRVLDQPFSPPVWSPDSRRIAFQAPDGLWVVDRDGGDSVLLSATGASPTWSPDGTWIAFSNRAAGDPPNDTDLMVVSSSGGAPRPLVDTDGDQIAPSWSPDGTLIAFVDKAPGPPANWYRVGVVRPDGSGLRIFPDAIPEEQIAWMPDSRRLVVARPGLHMLDLATGRTAQLNGFGGSAAPSPDGSLIAFSAMGECDRRGIYLVGADGKQLRRLTNKCLFVGTPGPDVLRGTDRRPDVLRGLGGDDWLYAVVAYAEGDTLYGGPGNDHLFGADRARDFLYGGPGNDVLHGMSGYDRLEGGRGRDRINGGPGRDGIYSRDGERDRIVCGSTSDRGERDRVWADHRDVVSRDCEIVYRSGRRS